MDEKHLLQAGFCYGLALTASRPDAEDLVQEAWYRLCRRHGRVKNRSLLFVAIRNLYIDRMRRHALVVFESLDVANEAADDRLDVFAGVIAARDLEVPLAALRSEEREALFLAVVEGHTAAEIAALTGRSRGTVLSLIYRARAKLRRALAGDGAPRQEGVGR